MATKITSGCVWVVLVIGIFSLFGAKAVVAGWGRLEHTNECIGSTSEKSGGKVCIVYDKLEGINCYVYTGSYGGGIFCMKAEK